MLAIVMYRTCPTGSDDGIRIVTNGLDSFPIPDNNPRDVKIMSMAVSAYAVRNSSIQYVRIHPWIEKPIEP